MLFLNGVRVAQWIARLPPKQKVVGSNPTSDVFLFISLVRYNIQLAVNLVC